MSDARKEVVIDLSRIAWPQSACPVCAHVGSGQPPWRWCRCDANYVTVTTLGEYQRLAKSAGPPRPPQLAPSMPGWSRRRAG